jgi:hypothetical protein
MYIHSLVFSFNFAYVVVFKTGILCYSCGSGVDWSADLCSAAGRACFESALPVLCSGIFWADCCADSNYCEVSFPFYFLLLCIDSFCGFGFSVFLLLLVVVDYLLIVWFLRFVLISAIFILWWWFSVLKCSLLLFILLNDVRCCVFIGFNLRSSRFFQRLCLGFFKISLGLMARVWMDGFSWY